MSSDNEISKGFLCRWVVGLKATKNLVRFPKGCYSKYQQVDLKLFSPNKQSTEFLFHTKVCAV